MGKTAEALQWAEKEYQVTRQDRSPAFLPTGRAKPPKRAWTHHPVMELYDDLKSNLLTRFSDGSIKTILFAGTAHGDGATTTAVNFAASLARDSRLKVLLIDVNLRTPSLHDVFKIDHLRGLSDLVVENGRGAPIKVGPENLHVIPCHANRSDPVTFFRSNGFDEFLKRVRDGYDHVVLDAPPVLDIPECRILCAKVNGVVLIIESGKTRLQDALGAQKRVEDAGGKLLGVVLNKRKYYIPEFIYRWL